MKTRDRGGIGRYTGEWGQTVKGVRGFIISSSVVHSVEQIKGRPTAMTRDDRHVRYNWNNIYFVIDRECVWDEGIGIDNYNTVVLCTGENPNCRDGRHFFREILTVIISKQSAESAYKNYLALVREIHIAYWKYIYSIWSLGFHPPLSAAIFPENCNGYNESEISIPNTYIVIRSNLQSWKLGFSSVARENRHGYTAISSKKS